MKSWISLDEMQWTIFRASNPDIVINAAAYTVVDMAESEPETAYAAYRDGPANLAHACPENNFPLFHISTDYVFDGNKQGGYSESDAPNPLNVYGKSKLEGDLAVASILDRHLILRVSWVFGANGNNFARTMLRLAEERDFLKVMDDQHGGPTWAGAIAAVFLDLARRWGDGAPFPWGIFHYSGQPDTTWKGFAEVIFARAEYLGMINRRPTVEPVTTADYPTPAQRPLYTILDCHKLEMVLGVSRPDWRTGLDRVLEVWKKR